MPRLRIKMCVTQKDLFLPVSRFRSQRASGSVRTICIVIRQSGLRTSLRSTTWAWSCHQWSHLSAPQSPPPPSSLCLRCTWWVQLWQPIIRTSSAYFLLWQSLWWGLEPHSIERWLKCMRSVVTAGVGSNIEMFRSLLWWLSQQRANPGYWNANIRALLAHVWGSQDKPGAGENFFQDQTLIWLNLVSPPAPQPTSWLLTI